MSSAPKFSVKFIVVAIILLIVQSKTAEAGSDLMCYACMSRNVPNVTRSDMSRMTNTPAFATSDGCNDPFSFISALRNGDVRFEPCSTACVKVVLENRYIRIVLRGCLSTFFATQMEGLPQIMIPSITETNISEEFTPSCDVDTEMNPSVGQIVTETCTCYENFCNAGDVVSYSVTVLFLLPVTVIASAYY